MESAIVHRDSEGFAVRMDLAVYGLEPVLKAAHTMTGRCLVHVEHVDEGHVLCRIRPMEAGADLERLASEFVNDALDQALRARIAAQTEPVRRLLLAQAFSKVNLLHPDMDAADPARDPARIASPDDAPA